MIRAWGITDQGAVRSQNQDAYYLKFLREDLVLAIVCDGMGGAKAGNVASSLAVDTAVEYLERIPPEKLANHGTSRMCEAARLANREVCRRSCRDFDCHGMGTTMVSLLLSKNKVGILNIGDSRAYRINDEGITKVTRDHSVVEELVYRGEITPEQARLHPNKNLITRCLGNDSDSRPDLFELKVKPGDYLLLCTDGLSNVLTDQEILYEVLHGEDTDSACQRMVNIALERGAPDNVTVVLIEVK